MVTNYFFKVGILSFVIEDRKSKLGFSYPRIIVIWPDGSRTFRKLPIRKIANLSPQQSVAKFNEEVVTLSSKNEIYSIAKEYGINWDEFENFCFEILDKASKM